MSGFEQKPQYLMLTPNSDGKKWVAEIVGDDPVYRLKRSFLPKISEGTYEIYDGYYQIHGIYPGISPFNKEYCRVKDGHMQRFIPVQQVYRRLPEIIALEGERQARLKHQIEQCLQEIADEVDHEWVIEQLHYQREQLDDCESSEQLMLGLGQLLKQKNHMIQQFKHQLGLLEGE